MVSYPRNAFTQIIESGSMANQTGDYRRTMGASAGPQPTVRSSDLGSEVPELSPEERAELDAKAIAIGIMSPTGTEPDGLEFAGHYASDDEVEQERVAAREALVKASHAAPTPMTRVDHRGVMMKMMPTLPDFKRVEKIDFLEHTLVVGGMSFQMPSDMEAELRKKVILTVAAEVQAHIALALDAFGAEVLVAETVARGEGDPPAGA